MTESNQAQSPAPADDDRSRRERRDRGVDKAAVIWGGILLVVGIWFFLDQTLGIDLPSIDWGDVWPVIIIVVGAALLYRGWRRRTE